MSMRNHHHQQQEEDQEPMDHHKNSNLETTHNHHHVPPSSSSQDFKKTHQDFKKTHHQHMGTHISHKTHEDDQGFIFKNATKVIKNPTFFSSSSLAAGEGYTMPPPPPPSPPPSPPPPPLPPQDFKKIHHVSNKINGNEGFTMENTNSLSCSSPLPPPPPPEVAETVVEEEEESVRDRITRHRVEMAGRVRIPDMWGHEDLLKDWIDCTVFDSNLGNKSIMSARAALVQERRSTLRIKNQC